MNFTMTWGDAALNLGLAVVAIGLWAGSARIYEWIKDIWRERSRASASREMLRLEHEKAEFERLLVSPEDYQRRTFRYVRDMIWLSFNTLACVLFTIFSLITGELERLKPSPHPLSLEISVGFGIFFLVSTYIQLISVAIVWELSG